MSFTFSIPHPLPGLTDLQIQQNFQAIADQINHLAHLEPDEEE
jgi:hypothetical protein